MSLGNPDDQIDFKIQVFVAADGPLADSVDQQPGAPEAVCVRRPWSAPTWR